MKTSETLAQPTLPPLEVGNFRYTRWKVGDVDSTLEGKGNALVLYNGTRRRDAVELMASLPVTLRPELMPYLSGERSVSRWAVSVPNVSQATADGIKARLDDLLSIKEGEFAPPLVPVGEPDPKTTRAAVSLARSYPYNYQSAKSGDVLAGAKPGETVLILGIGGSEKVGTAMLNNIMAHLSAETVGMVKGNKLPVFLYRYDSGTKTQGFAYVLQDATRDLAAQVRAAHARAEAAQEIGRVQHRAKIKDIEKNGPKFPLDDLVFHGTHRPASEVGLERVPETGDGLTGFTDGLRVSQHPEPAQLQGKADMAHQEKEGTANFLMLKVLGSPLMLELDKPLGSQPAARKALSGQPWAEGSSRKVKTGYRFNDEQTGWDVYRALLKSRVVPGVGMVDFERASPDSVARELVRLGFAGISTLDTASYEKKRETVTRDLIFFDYKPLVVIAQNGEMIPPVPVKVQAATLKNAATLKEELEAATQEWQRCEDDSPELSAAADKVLAARKAWVAQRETEKPYWEKEQGWDAGGNCVACGEAGRCQCKHPPIKEEGIENSVENYMPTAEAEVEAESPRL